MGAPVSSAPDTNLTTGLQYAPDQSSAVGSSSEVTSAPSRRPADPVKARQVLASGTVLLLCAILVMLFFSQTFELGDELLHFLLDQVTGIYTRTWMILAAAVGVFVLMYLADCSYWKGFGGVLLRRLGTVAVFVCLALCGILLIDDYPYLPLSLAMLTLPLAALFLKATLYSTNDPSDVSCVMGINFLTASLIVLIIWLCWLLGAWSPQSNHWFENRAYFLEAAKCGHAEWSNSSVTRVSDGSRVCLAAFLLWASPLMIFGICIFLGIFLVLLSRTMTHRDASSTKYAIKFLAMVVFLTVLGMYSATSVSGAGMQLSYAAYAMYGVALVATLIITGAVVGWSTAKTSLEKNSYIQKMRHLGSPSVDIMHGFFVLACPFYVVFLALSAVNQALRKACKCGVCKPLTDDDRQLTITLVAHRLNKHLKTWNWTYALFCAQILCIAMWSYRYVTIVCNIGFNALITVLSRLHWALTSAIFVVIGLVMFLLPVVPGPLVYLTSGVLIVPTMQAGLPGGRPAEPACGGAGGNSTADGADEEEYSTVAFVVACAWANVISCTRHRRPA